MSLRLLIPLFFLCTASLPAQAPSRTSETHTSPLGFSYSLPNDWDVVDTQPTLPEMKRQQSQNASTDQEKKGIQCVQVALTARHGTPASVVVVVALPFDCFGQQMTEKDLPGFVQGASQGIKRSFVVSDPCMAPTRWARTVSGSNEPLAPHWPSRSEVHSRDCLQPALEKAPLAGWQWPRIARA